MWLPCFGIVAGLAILVLLCASLPYMSIRTGVIVAVTLQQVNCTPDAETGTKCHNECLKNGNCTVEKSHMGNSLPCWRKCGSCSGLRNVLRTEIIEMLLSAGGWPTGIAAQREHEKAALFRRRDS